MHSMPSVIRTQCGSFRYAPLNQATEEIRILQIHFNKGKDDLQFVLSHKSLDKLPRYIALSYVWGSLELTEKITIDGKSLFITSNLATALRSTTILDSTADATSLWIDAICINQEDPNERSQQVLRMRQIYSQAQQTLIWLGPESNDSNYALDFLEELTSKVNYTRESIIGLTKGRDFGRKWAALYHLFQREWWNRVWVIQECVVSCPYLVCGEKKIRYNNLQSAMSALQVIIDWQHYHNSQILPFDERTAERINSHMFFRTWWHASCSMTIPITLLTALHTSRRASASDKRDKIYAVLGLAVDANELIPRPNYDISIQQLYSMLVKSYINTKNDLEIICHAGKQSTSNQLPTWTPDWSNNIFPNSFSISTAHRESTPSCYRAGGVMDIQPTFSGDLTRIMIYGYVFDEVLSIANSDSLQCYEFHQTPSDEKVYEDDGKVFKALCYSLFAQSSSLGRTSFELYEQKFVEVCRQTYPADKKNTLKDPVKEWYEENKQFYIHGRSLENWIAKQPKSLNNSPITVKSSYSSESDPFRESFGRTNFRRQLFTTKRGYIGLAPLGADCGDIVCIFPGCSVPLILRQQQWFHELIGDCYVHGIMNGEAIDKMCSTCSLTSLTHFTLL